MVMPSCAGPDFSEAYHTFAVQWEPGECVWYVDGVERARAREGVPDVPIMCWQTKRPTGTRRAKTGECDAISAVDRC